MHACSGPPRRTLSALVLVAAAALCGCATVSGRGGCGDTQRDPLEPLNRRTFAFNLALDRAVIKPVARAYRFLLPEAVRDGIRGVVDNLKEPRVFLNDLLQGRGTAAGITAKRFVINSTVGLAGIRDPAARWGLPRQSGDFGQTLYAWGVADGPYLVLPFFGPSSVRDGVGLGVDLYANPVAQAGSPDVRREVGFATGAADGIDLRSRNIETLDELERSSLDFYAYLRSVTRQQRQSVLREAKAPTGTQPDEELLDPGAPAPTGARPGTGTPADPAQPAAPADRCDSTPPDPAAR